MFLRLKIIKNKANYQKYQLKVFFWQLFLKSRPQMSKLRKNTAKSL